FGERERFFGGHPAEVDGHQQRGHLIIGYFAVGVSTDDEVDFITSEIVAVALFGYDIDCSHSQTLYSGSQFRILDFLENGFLEPIGQIDLPHSRDKPRASKACITDGNARLGIADKRNS